jgi:hypothetical protein
VHSNTGPAGPAIASADATRVNAGVLVKTMIAREALDSAEARYYIDIILIADKRPPRCARRSHTMHPNTQEREIVVLDDERKAAMVSNLLVVLCSDKDAQPIVNAGTLYA